MSFCPKCGKEIGDWKFCNHCGSNIDYCLKDMAEARENYLIDQSLDYSNTPSIKHNSDSHNNKQNNSSHLTNPSNSTSKKEKITDNESTNKSKKLLIFVSSIIVVLVAVVVILVIALFNNYSIDESQNEQKQLSTTEILLKAKDLFGEYVSLENYEPYILDREESAVFFNVKNDINYKSNLSDTIYVGDSIPLTFIQTKTSDLLSSGFSKGDIKKEHISNLNYPYADDVCLIYNNKRLYIDENEDGAIEFGLDSIRAIHLPVKEAVNFEYCGISNSSNFQDVVNCLGEPSGSSDIHYELDNDNCIITLSYICDVYTPYFDYDLSVFAYFIFTYDYKSNSTELRDIYMFA